MIKTWLNEKPSLMERMDAFLQIVTRVSVQGEPVYTTDSYEVDRRRNNTVSIEEERKAELKTELKKLEENNDTEVDDIFCLGILLVELLCSEEYRGEHRAGKILDLIFSGADHYEFGVLHFDEKLGGGEILEACRELGRRMTAFDKNKRMSMAELQESLYRLFGDTKCNIKYVDVNDEEKEIFTHEIRYSGFKNVITVEVEKNSAYRPVKPVEFYVRALEMTIAVKAESVDDSSSEYKTVPFPEETLIVTFHKSFYYVYENDFKHPKRISIALGKRPEEDLRDYVREYLSQNPGRQVLVSVPEAHYESLKKTVGAVEEVKLYPEIVPAARFYRQCYEAAGRRLLYVGLGSGEAEFCIAENDKGEDYGIKLEVSNDLSCIQNVKKFTEAFIKAEEDRNCVISYCEITSDDMKNSERAETVKNILGNKWKFLTGTDVLAKGLALYETKNNSALPFIPGQEELGIMMKDIAGRIFFYELPEMGRCYELKEKLSNIPAKFVVWARRRGALPYLTGMEVYGNDMRPVFRVSIKEDRKDKSLSGKAQTVVLRFDCSEGRIRPECQIGGNRTITVESIKEERDYSWIKRLYK